MSKEKPNPQSLANISLDAAKEGSIEELQNLQGQVPTLPSYVLPEVAEIFLSHLDCSELPSPNSGLIRLGSDLMTTRRMFLLRASISLWGIRMIAETNHFRSDSTLSKLIFGMWSSIAETISVIYDERSKQHSFFDGIAWNTMQILAQLGYVDGKEIGHVLQNKRTQILICKFWSQDIDDENSELSSYILLCCYTSWRSGFFDCLLEVGSAQEYAKVALQRLETRSNKSGAQKEVKFVSNYMMVVALFVSQAPHELALAVIEGGGLNAVLKVLHLLHKNTPDIMNSPWAIGTASWALKFLSSAFDVKSGNLRKAVRRGLINIICGLSPWFPQMKENIQDASMPMKTILIASLPREMVFTRSIKVLADAFKGLSDKERKLMSESIVKEEWRNVEMLLIERHAVFRHMMVPRRAKECDAVGYAYELTTTSYLTKIALA